MKHFLFTLFSLLLLVSVAANAYDFSAKNDDGVTIYYNKSGSNATVTYKSSFSYNSYSGNVVIPETVTYNGTTYSVTGIGDNAFYKCTGLTSVTIPNSVTEIGNYAFDGCYGLTSVTIPNSVTEIGNGAFRDCTALTEVNFNATSCTSAGSSSSKRAFGGCTNISTVNFGDNVTVIPPYLFCYQEKLTGITLPNSVITIGDEAFYYCTGLTGTLTIPNSVTSIGNWAFGWCVDLTGTLTIPNSVSSIGDYAFTYCTSLTRFEVAEDNEYYCAVDGVLFTKDMTTLIQFPAASSMTSYDIPNSVTEIGSYAFSDCTGLTSVTIPNSVTSIGNYAFNGCSDLMQVTIGKSVTTIGYSAFDYCSGMESIYSHNPEPPTISTYAFYQVDKNTCILYVPVDSKDKYSTADCWSEFINIEEKTFNDLLIVQTYEATEVTTNSALLRGVVTVGDEEVLEQGFEYWADGGEVQTVTSPDLIMAVTLTGLEDGVTYTYRAYATTGSGASYSEEMTFTTIKAPTVQTYEVTEITENSALLKGYVTAGNEDLLGQGFEYWAAGGEVQTISMADQMMAVTITGLSEGITYTCRAYAKTASGTTYGNEVTFTTFTPPTVQTYEATEVTVSSATLSGVVVAGSEKVTEQGFEYLSSSGDVQTVASTSSMSVTVANLKSSTKYTYRAYAKTESGTTYGNDVSFTTLNIGVYKELDEAVEELNEDFNVAWTTVITDYPDAEEDCMDYYDAIFNKVKELTDLLDSSYRNGTLYDDVVSEIWSGIAEGERMIEEMLAAAKKVHETGIEDIIANCGDDVRVYDLAGRRVHRLERGNVYIIRYSDGTAKKVMVK